MGNLMEGLNEELKRNRELLKQYEEIGPAGMFGAAFIKQAICMAETAIAESDTVAMVRAYAKLKDMK